MHYPWVTFSIALACLNPFPTIKAAPLIQPKNLLINPSFEQGPVVGNYRPLSTGDTSMKGWTVSRGSVDLIGNYWQTAHGNRSLDLHGSPGRGGVKQTFSTKPGRIYTVTFAMAGNPEHQGLKKKTITITAAGVSEKFTFDVTGKTFQKMGWKRHKWRFTAKEKKTTLEIYSTTMDNDVYGPTLDSVSVSTN